MDRSVYQRMAEIDRDHWWFAARRDVVRELMRLHVAKGRKLRILEVGCGTGSNLELLGEFGQVDAIEPDDMARDFASARSGLTVLGGYLPGVPLEPQAYDAIIMLDVLEHIPDDVAALNALKPALAPGGKLLVTVPANPWLWSAHDEAHHHQRRYTRGTLAATLTKGGFRSSHISGMNTLLLPLIIGARLVGRLLGRDGGDDAMPRAPLNAALRAIFRAERLWVPRVCVPWGVSLAAVAEPA